MKHYHLDEALKRAARMGFDVQRNHESNGYTEVVVAFRDWELVRRGACRTGSASSQAAFINRAINRIMQVVEEIIPAVMYRSARNVKYAVSRGASLVWSPVDKNWSRSIISAGFISEHMYRVGDVKIRRTKMYLPEDL